MFFLLQDGKALFNDSMESKIDATVLKSLSASDCDGQQPTCENMSNVTVADMNVWDMSLSMTTMSNYTTCRLLQIIKNQGTVLTLCLFQCLYTRKLTFLD